MTSKTRGFRYKAMVPIGNKFMRSHTWDRLVDAQKEERELLKARDEGQSVDFLSPLPFDKAFSQWHEDCRRRRCSIAYLELIRQQFKSHLSPFFSNRNLKKIKPSDIGGFVEYMGKKNLSNQTVNGILVGLKSCFNFHLEENNLAFNPVKKKHKLPEILRNQKPVWTKEEVERFVTFVGKKYQGEKRWPYIFYKIGLNSGMRFGEILVLQKSDFDFENSRIVVSKSFCSASGQIKAPKNNQIRYATLPPQLAEEVKRYIVDGQIFGPLFTKPNGEYQNLSTFRRYYLDDMKVAGVRITKFHNFRRFFVTAFIERGGHEAHLRKLVGHASEEMTDTYTVLRDDLGPVATIVNI